MKRVDDADWHSDNTTIRHIRFLVFVEEQQMPLELDFDGRDPACHHVLAFGPKGAAIGTGRIEKDGRIGRLAVLAEHRGEGFGKDMLDRLVGWAAAQGLEGVYLDAQAIAEPFYKKQGFETEGEVFVDVGIEHRRMRKTF